jgi:hypothetical protein
MHEILTDAPADSKPPATTNNTPTIYVVQCGQIDATVEAQNPLEAFGLALDAAERTGPRVRLGNMVEVRPIGGEPVYRSVESCLRELGRIGQ